MAGSPKNVLALLGAGYMGGSLALAARRAGLVTGVVGYDPDPRAAAEAVRLGIVDRAAATPAEAASGAEVVVLAAPVRSLIPLGQAIAGAVDPGALVFDIGSVKGPVVAGLAQTTLAGQFVGCHPLAGTEASGPAAADPDLYRGKPCFICPGPGASATAIDRAESFWKELGASVLRLDPEAHDVFMAAGSHLPHVAAFTLAASLQTQADMLVARIPTSYPPTSLRDSTRVAASNPAVWRDILLENRTHLLPLIDRLQDQLAQLRQAMAANDAPAVQAVLQQGQSCRRRIVL